MPQEIETITTDELITILKCTRQALDKRANIDNWQYDTGPRNIKLYYIDELPPDVQERIFRYRYGIDEAGIKEMVEQFDLKVPAKKMDDPALATKIRMLCECLAVPMHVRGRKARIAYIADSYGYDVRTAYRLMDRVKQGKNIVKAEKNYGVTVAGLGITLRAWDQEAAEYAVKEIMANRQSKQEKLAIYKRIERDTQEAGLKIGCYESFLQLNKKVNETLKTYRDKGVRGLREDVVPAIRRDPTAYRPMENLVGDQHKADYYALDYNGDLITLELFCWLDFRTQMVWGSVAYKHYNRYTVGQALINAVRWGLPSSIYTDWGKPERSHYISQLVGQLKGLGVRTEEIRHTKARVKHPQAKPIESWFGWLDRNLKNARIPGYCKRLTDARENDMQQKEIKRQAKAGELLDMQELIDRIFAVIRSWNEHAFKNRREDTGLSPLDIYNQETQTTPVTTLSDDVLDYIFLPFQTCKVKRSQIKIKYDWLGSISFYDTELSYHTGAEATVRFDPFNAHHAWVFIDGHLICRAEEWGMINPKNSDQVAGKIEKQNHLIKIIREKYNMYKPKTKAIPRIGPHDREAKQVKKVKKDLRVIRTQLENIDAATGEIMESGQEGRGSLLTSYRKMYRMDSVNDEPKKLNLKPFLRLSIDDPAPLND